MPEILIQNGPLVTPALTPFASRLRRPDSPPNQDREQLLANSPILSSDIKLQFPYP